MISEHSDRVSDRDLQSLTSKKTSSSSKPAGQRPPQDKLSGCPTQTGLHGRLPSWLVNLDLMKKNCFRRGGIEPLCRADFRLNLIDDSDESS